MRWQLILEEFGPELIYVKGEDNAVADALSRLDRTECPILQNTIQEAECFASKAKDKLKPFLPINLKLIHDAQQQNKKLLALAQSNTEYEICTSLPNASCGGERIEAHPPLIYKKEQISFLKHFNHHYCKKTRGLLFYKSKQL